MHQAIRALVLAAATFMVAMPGHAATVPNVADFSVVESPGQYTVYNNSTSWYVYGFAVSNPSAADPSVVATTDFTNWSGLNPNPSLDLNTGTPQLSFAYASADADLSNLNNPTLTTVTVSNYIGPGSFSDRFFFGSTVTASNFGLLVVSLASNETNFATVNGITIDGTTPLPAALPLFATGLGGLGLLGWRRKRKAKAMR